MSLNLVFGALTRSYEQVAISYLSVTIMTLLNFSWCSACLYHRAGRMSTRSGLSLETESGVAVVRDVELGVKAVTTKETKDNVVHKRVANSSESPP
jgi:hypothetical protein